MTNSPTSNLSSASLQESVDLGEIMFSLCYLPTAGRLTLTVIKCRNLKAMDITGYSGTSPAQGACLWPPGSPSVRIWREKGENCQFSQKSSCSGRTRRGFTSLFCHSLHCHVFVS